MNKQKGFIKILLIIVAVIALAVFIYIRMGYRTETIPSNITDNKTSSSLQSSKKDVTAGWKTYRNDKYGFEIKYPQDWVLKTNENSAGGTDYQYTGFVNPENNYTFFINILARSTPDDFIGNMGGMGYRKDYVSVVEADKIVRTILPREGEESSDFSFKLGRMKSVRTTSGLSEADPWDSEIKQAVFVNNKFGYIIGYGIGEDSNKNWNQATIEKMDDMVRTFRLTK